MFVAIDNGKSENNSLETHKTIWVDVEKVEQVLSYESLKTSWRAVKKDIFNLLEDNKV